MLQKKAAQRCGEVSIVLAFGSIVISSYSFCSDYARNALRFGCVVYARFATPTPSMPSMPSTHTPTLEFVIQGQLQCTSLSG